MLYTSLYIQRFKNEKVFHHSVKISLQYTYLSDISLLNLQKKCVSLILSIPQKGHETKKQKEY